MEEEIFFDFQAPVADPTVTAVAEALAQISAGAFLIYFSFNELMTELREFRKMHGQRKEIRHG